MSDTEDRLRDTLHRRALDPTPSDAAWEHITARGQRRGQTAKLAAVATCVAVAVVAVPLALGLLHRPTIEFRTAVQPPDVANVAVDTLEWGAVDHDFVHPDGPVQLTDVAALDDSVVVTGSVMLPAGDPNDGYRSVPTVWFSADVGATWEGPWMAADLVGGELNPAGEASVAAIRDAFRLAIVVTDEESSGIRSVVLGSEDGRNWHDTEHGPALFAASLQSTPRGLIASGGDPDDPDRGELALSKDGTRWSSEALTWPEGASVYQLAAGPNALVAAGFTQPVVHHSADGRDWEAIAPDGGDDQIGRIEAVATDRDGFVLVASTSQTVQVEAESAPARAGHLFIGRSADGREWHMEDLHTRDPAEAASLLALPGGTVILGARTVSDGTQPVAWVRNRTGQWHVRPLDAAGWRTAQPAAATASPQGGVIAIGSTKPPEDPTLEREASDPDSVRSDQRLPETHGRIWLGKPSE